MRRALDLAWSALGSTSPNPSVGAVVTQGGKAIGEGHTQPPGQAHAEVMALRDAGELTRGAALYVTLEPCNHHGRTPPCTDAIITAGVSAVNIALRDPNPNVSGGGIERLQAAGIEVHVGEGANEASKVMEAFFKHSRTGMPFVTAKFASSLDGKIATRTGDSKWITGTESRQYVHTLRSQADVIMVGINTVLTDNPKLTVRDKENKPVAMQPMRVIVDSRGRTPRDAGLLREPGKTLVVVTDQAADTSDLAAMERVEVMALPERNGRVDLAAMMRCLGERGVTSVFVEGGGTLLGALFDHRLVDKVVGFVSPVIIGGMSAPGPVGGQGVALMTEGYRLRDVEILRFGADIAMIGYCEAG
jgi:diaminohydroxyphosphoribosylaminopyrimidine deaminase/5-amino-6-(5-phosphoribosylamino)uracil reductase